MKKIIKNNLRFYREKAGLTLQDLANATGISMSMLYFVEKNNRGISFFLADRIAYVLDVPLEEIFPEFAERKSPLPTK
ncbi:DNA-binding transcriptional regulator, XRE-family HTH domain [Marinitoga hydrogenitolerans DSM 16785]|uniref:DNA-binding transcriptional regulator, XRE-family HTH domain n=1 Tax=Marinitoga hydrogenitolerans (strain DSM 16785 / JCM 12826 / AT1271) TaxID=1122195 RepID=A0A1M4TRR2_MARH1|nr:helix-turn-helix transcriptional regulator [Marinitoga hydrogenitolerans]SHE47161.1 DNA-binding transcriptional regulator, XRE-family HTH domain [Marinitoga hydrogenitolerans DSM 16785]